MRTESRDRRPPRRLVRGIVRLVAILLLVLAVSVSLLVAMTDLGRGRDRNLEEGLFAEADLVLHLHRPDRVLNELAGGDARRLLDDPDWRWLLGLPEGGISGPAAGLLDDLLEGELVLAVSWAAGEDRASDRILAALRPSSSRLPRLLQLMRSRWAFTRFVLPLLPPEVTATWIDGLVLLVGGNGRGDLVVGSALDLVVVGSTIADVRRYLDARRPGLPAPEERRDELRLSARARAQLLPALRRTLGPELHEKALALGDAAAEEVVLHLADSGALEWPTVAAEGAEAAARALAEAVRSECPGIEVGGGGGDSPGRLLALRADGAGARAALGRLEADRIRLEEEPSGERLEELREELRPPGAPPLGDEALRTQLWATRALRLERARRETAAWSRLLERGLALEILRDGDRLLYRLAFRTPTGK